ncbi:GNAT family N-acetyltransferase [Streptomyces sp. NPDC001594]|uniref:GNAT family N-acetyltransferase n=1 Tax=Streptomyces sp. NPDC001594 TaxID=3364590 RepID=UPI0036C7E941
MPCLRTDRLLLRRWRESDLEPWAAMNADPEVREHLGELLTREQSDAAVALMQTEFDERGFGWWALEARETGEFIGRADLDEVDEDMPFAGVDIGWRLTRSADDFEDPSVPEGPLRQCVLYRTARREVNGLHPAGHQLLVVQSTTMAL